MGRNDASQKKSRSRKGATTGALSHSAQQIDRFPQRKANFFNSYLPSGNPFSRLGPGALTDRHKNTAAEMLRRPLPQLLKGPHPGGAFVLLVYSTLTILQDCPIPQPPYRRLYFTLTILQESLIPSPPYREKIYIYHPHHPTGKKNISLTIHLAKLQYLIK